MLDAQCVKVTVTAEVQAGNLSLLPQSQSMPAQAVWGVRPVPEPLLHTGSHRCVPGRPTRLSVSLFIRGVHNPPHVYFVAELEVEVQDQNTSSHVWWKVLLLAYG